MTPIRVTHDGQARQYWLQIADVRPCPVVLFLHGTGATADWAANECRLPEFAASRFHLVVPEALPARPDQPSRFFTNPTRWNDGSRAPVPELATNVDDVGYLSAVIDDALARCAMPPQPVFISGFSNGAGMAFRYAQACAERVRAIAPVAGYCADPTRRPGRPIPTLYLIGDADPLIPLAGGAVRVPWGNRGGPVIVQRPAIAAMLQDWAAAIAPAELRTVIVPGLGHHWPGGRGQLNPRIGGPVVSTVAANPLIWEFFQAHTPPE